jgi:hypothetical protein
MRESGAILFCKTNVPTAMMSGEASRIQYSINPYVRANAVQDLQCHLRLHLQPLQSIPLQRWLIRRRKCSFSSSRVSSRRGNRCRRVCSNTCLVLRSILA